MRTRWEPQSRKVFSPTGKRDRLLMTVQGQKRCEQWRGGLTDTSESIHSSPRTGAMGRTARTGSAAGMGLSVVAVTAATVFALPGLGTFPAASQVDITGLYNT